MTDPATTSRADTQPLRVLPIGEVRAAAPTPIDENTRLAARDIVDAVRTEGESGLRAFAERLDRLAPDAPLLYDRDALQRALESVDADTRALLERTAARIAAFADAQRAAIQPLDVEVPGGRAGHDVVPVAAAGCYAPGGRYPLPSSVLMTAVTARSAGVERVVVASPDPHPVVLAAAAVAGADALLATGGAQAVAALAYGIPGLTEPVDIVVGPGNRWVTAAKQIVYGDVGIDLPAGPSELVVLADGTADPDLIAADLLAQAEHDPDARPALVTTDASLVERVERHLAERLAVLDTAEVARAALGEGFATVASTFEEALEAVDALAPEHLQICVKDPAAAKDRLRHFGAAFLGERSAEVFGDYGVGPNHVLPTGGAARYSGGLGVLSFLRVRTWLRLDDVAPVATDVETLARLERLTGHAEASRARSTAR
ncbi:MAG: histidinol dehydrogenase [Planctomycetota bacterium]